MSDDIAAKRVPLSRIASTFRFPEPGKPTDTASLGAAITSVIAQAAGGAITVGAAQAVMGLASMMMQSGIMCDDSNSEPPSPMEPRFRDGKVTFRCKHSPAHEFDIDV
ncbi:hypothetical protein ACN2XU_02340 [Primorskyibacter sp. 2E107]|uniref:hypothetical protein n=1 Tax=Primorskyibacter sp. 2E107 TaxID=3403458 RepID=UPI003AF5C486